MRQDEVRADLDHEAARGAPRRHAAGQPGVVPITQLPAVVRDVIFEWRNARTADLLFTHRDDSIIAMVVLIGLAMAVLVGRALTRNKAGRTQVALPAVLDWSGGSWTSIVRHGALILFLAGLPFFVMAFADPYSSLTHEQVSFPGRRIALMIDASSSMMARFPGRAPQRQGAERGDLLHHRRRGGDLHPPAHERQVSRPDRPDRVRRRGLRRHAVHERLRQHPAQPEPDRRLDRVHEVPRSGHDDRAGDRAERRAVQGVRLPRRRRQPDADVHRRPGHAGDDSRQERERDPRRRAGRPRSRST